MKEGTCLVSMTDPVLHAAGIFFPPPLSVYQRAGFSVPFIYVINSLALYRKSESSIRRDQKCLRIESMLRIELHRRSIESFTALISAYKAILFNSSEVRHILIELY